MVFVSAGAVQLMTVRLCVQVWCLHLYRCSSVDDWPCVQVQSLIAAAKESMMCALRLQREVDLTKQVTKQDVELHERLVNQVSGGTTVHS